MQVATPISEHRQHVRVMCLARMEESKRLGSAVEHAVVLVAAGTANCKTCLSLHAFDREKLLGRKFQVRVDLQPGQAACDLALRVALLRLPSFNSAADSGRHGPPFSEIRIWN